MDPKPARYWTGIIINLLLSAAIFALLITCQRKLFKKSRRSNGILT